MCGFGLCCRVHGSCVQFGWWHKGRLCVCFSYLGLVSVSAKPVTSALSCSQPKKLMVLSSILLLGQGCSAVIRPICVAVHCWDAFTFPLCSDTHLTCVWSLSSIRFSHSPSTYFSEWAAQASGRWCVPVLARVAFKKSTVSVFTRKDRFSGRLSMIPLKLVSQDFAEGSSFWCFFYKFREQGS